MIIYATLVFIATLKEQSIVKNINLNYFLSASSRGAYTATCK